MIKRIVVLTLFIFQSSFCNLPNFVLIGPPGCGKGTFSEFMKEYCPSYNYRQISIGDIVRKEIASGTPRGKILAAIPKGKFIPNEIAFDIIEKQILDCMANSQPFIVDGFPKTEAAFDFLVAFFKEKEISSTVQFIHFLLDDNICIQRISGRSVCTRCGKSFNQTNRKPSDVKCCDNNPHSLKVRPGDTVEVTKARLLSYRLDTQPLVGLALKNRFNVFHIDASMSIEQCYAVYSRLMQYLQKPLVIYSTAYTTDGTVLPRTKL
jgi:adenylate kinase